MNNMYYDLCRKTLPSPKQFRQRGFSLIELMIALAIGLFIMATVLTIYVASSRTSRMSEVESQMNEDGLIALNIVQQQIRMAGYSNYEVANNTDKLNYKGAGVVGCSAAAFYPNAAQQEKLADISAAECAAASGNGDGIVVRYEADAFNTTPTSSGNPTNCLMQSALTVPANGTTPTYNLAENRYYVATSATNPTPAIYCAAATGTKDAASENIQMQPVLDNVEKMELRYGISATNAADDTQIVTYLKASDVDGIFASEAVDDRWRRVVSVKACLLMRSSDRASDIAASATYRDCSGNLVTLANPDGYLRRAFITTATLRNRLTITDKQRKNES